MAYGKNPFERNSSSGKSDGANKPPPSSQSSGLPPTRASGVKETGDKPPGRAVAGYEPKPALKAPKHPQVSNTGPQGEPPPALWVPQRIPPKPGQAPAVIPGAPGAAPGIPAVGGEAVVPGTPGVPAVSPFSETPGANAMTIASNAQGVEVMVSSPSSDNYAKAYAKHIQESHDKLVEVAGQQVTADNYKEVYQAQEQLAAELRAETEKTEKIIEDRNKKNAEIVALKGKAQQLQSDIAALKMRLGKEGPDVDHNLYASIAEKEHALFDINPVYWN